MGVPPGSRNKRTSRPKLRKRAARRGIWVVLPPPSVPSRVMKSPSMHPVLPDLKRTQRADRSGGGMGIRSGGWHRRGGRKNSDGRGRGVGVVREPAGEIMHEGGTLQLGEDAATM